MRVSVLILAISTSEINLSPESDIISQGFGHGRMYAVYNFINQELWGRPTDLPWGMIFPVIDSVPRHPSQIYEAMLEGIILFTILWIFSSEERKIGQTSGLFLLLYGVFRFGIEFTREPDRFLGLLFLNLTMGQILCLPMIGIGIYIFLKSKGLNNID